MRSRSFGLDMGNVVPFPIPARAALPASPHARGKRPYHFIRAVDPWHAPGARKDAHGMRCAADAAWLIQGALGFPPGYGPHAFPGLPHVRQAAQARAESAKLYPFQAEGAAFLAQRDYAILADEMGVGKTPQAIIAAEARLQFAQCPPEPTPQVLVVCPALAKRHWQREVRKWTGETATILDGVNPYASVITELLVEAGTKVPKSDDAKVRELDDLAVERFLNALRAYFPTVALSPSDLPNSLGEIIDVVQSALVGGGYTGAYLPLPRSKYIITNYDLLPAMRRRDDSGVVKESQRHPGWGDTLRGRFLIVIFDEAHGLRGRSTKRARVCKKVAQGVPVVWALTGTPMPNYVRDLWGLIDVTTDGLHGAYWDWARKYTGAHQGSYGWVDTGADYLDELQRRLSFFMMGRSKQAVALQLPPKRREVYRIDVEMTAPTVRDANQALMRQRAVAKALRATARAKRSAVVAQATEALEAKQKVVVFTYMREHTEKIGEALKAAAGTVAIVHGDQTADMRDAMATAFREAQAPAAFVCTIDSVGVAISLVGADLVLFADLSHEPWKLLQAEGRSHRHGSTKPVIVRYLIGIGTIDEAVAESVVEKLAVTEETLGEDPEGKGLSSLLGPDPQQEKAIVDRLFDKLKAWGAK